MKTSIFIRAYAPDFPWLFNCLRSIEKYCTGYHEVVIHVDTHDLEALRPNLPNRHEPCPVKVVSSGPFCYRGYLNQQIVKIHADLWCMGDLICFVDCDCLFTRKNTPETLLGYEVISGKPTPRPIMIFTPYSVLGNAVPWKQPTEDVIKDSVANEFMRRMPLTYHRDTLKGFRDWFDTTGRGALDGYICQRGAFSEFNALGAWAYTNHRERYYWLDSMKDAMPEPHIRQFWSHSSVESCQSEINDILSR